MQWKDHKLRKGRSRMSPTKKYNLPVEKAPTIITSTYVTYIQNLFLEN